jgi:hypothetical protein
MHPNHILWGKFEALTPVVSVAEDLRLLVCDNDAAWVLPDLPQRATLPSSSGSSSSSRGTCHADLGPLNTEDEGTVTLHKTSNYLPLEMVQQPRKSEFTVDSLLFLVLPDIYIEVINFKCNTLRHYLLNTPNCPLFILLCLSVVLCLQYAAQYRS